MNEIKLITDVFPSRQEISYSFPTKLLPTDAKSLDLLLGEIGIAKREMFTLRKKDSSTGPTHIESALTEALKYEIPHDNSCLFNAIAYLCEGSSNRGPELRSHVVREIRAKPDTYTEATLGCSPEEYCRWIADPIHWGGYIEMEILSRFYKIEICMLYIEEGNMVPVNACNATKRVFVLYNNQHYDAVYFKGFGVPEKKIVDADDQTALQLALELVRICKTAGDYTRRTICMIKCENCGKVFQGQKEAEDHAKATGHMRFAQAD